MLLLSSSKRAKKKKQRKLLRLGSMPLARRALRQGWQKLEVFSDDRENSVTFADAVLDSGAAALLRAAPAVMGVRRSTLRKPGAPAKALAPRARSFMGAPSPLGNAAAASGVQVDTPPAKEHGAIDSPEGAVHGPADSAVDIARLQLLLAEKDAALAALEVRLAALEVGQGARAQLEALDAQSAHLRELVREKDCELAAARSARRRALLPMVAAAAGAAERRMAQEAQRWATKALRALHLRVMTPPPLTPPGCAEPPASTGRSPYYFSPCSFKPVSPSQVRKGRFVVLVAGYGAGGDMARPTFCLAGEALALARVESVAEGAIKLHSYAAACDRPGVLAFAPCVNARGYPLLAPHHLAGDLVAAFDALACPERGGGGCLPAEVIAEIAQRLQGRCSECGSDGTPVSAASSWRTH
ncbi:hypothetical protein WJX81_007224 [Elliptochloris bilobata]|uniref:Uncharacterized protein n=1 Tax=Elliptochloris bilobata TaxID=381761 RepID=A0AAW1RG06_9CHLO